MKNKVCERCGEVYNPDSHTQKYCPVCGGMVAMEKARERWRRWAARERERKQQLKKEKLT